VKKNNIIKIIFSMIILFPFYSYGNNNADDEWIAGKIEFTGENRQEGIAVISSPGKKIFLNKNALLFIKKGKARIILKIIDMDGKYFKYNLLNESKGLDIKPGDDVYYSEKLNSNKKYGDVKKILSELIHLYEGFILKIESTEDALIISEAVKKFSMELDMLIPEMKRVNSKYPELKRFSISPPNELKNESEILRILEPRVRDAIFKIKMYSSDERVKKAGEDLQRVLKKLETEQ
jgi:hypothetical protein